MPAFHVNTVWRFLRSLMLSWERASPDCYLLLESMTLEVRSCLWASLQMSVVWMLLPPQPIQATNMSLNTRLQGHAGRCVVWASRAVKSKLSDWQKYTPPSEKWRGTRGFFCKVTILRITFGGKEFYIPLLIHSYIRLWQVLLFFKKPNYYS